MVMTRGGERDPADPRSTSRGRAFLGALPRAVWVFGPIALLAGLSLLGPPAYRAWRDRDRSTPLAGRARFSLRLEAEREFARREGEDMVARIEAGGASASLRHQDVQTIELDVDAASSVVDVTAAIAPHALSFHLLGPGFPPEGEMPPLPSKLRWSRLGQVQSNPPSVILGGCDAARDYATQPVSMCLVAVEDLHSDDPDSDQPLCRVLCLDPEPVLRGHDIDSITMAEVSDEPVVLMTFTSAGATRLGQASAERIGSVMAVVVDGEIVTLPTITSRLGARLQIVPGLYDAEHGVELWRMLADGGLFSPWRLVDARTE